MSHDEMSQTFEKWNQGELDSFLIEISTNILKYRDESGDILLEKIKDSAGQKGTGKWTAISALEYGMPVTLIGESVFARCLSSLKDEREKASTILKGPESEKYDGDKEEFVEAIRQALYASKIVSYAQGFMLLQKAREEFGWDLNLGGIALMWRGGCIIRRYTIIYGSLLLLPPSSPFWFSSSSFNTPSTYSRFLGDIKDAFTKNPKLTNLLLDPFFKSVIERCQVSPHSSAMPDEAIR